MKSAAVSEFPPRKSTPAPARSISFQDHESLSQFYDHVRAQTIALAAPLAVEDQVVQSMADASPTKWHLAHTTWFFETFVLKAFASDYQVLHPAYDHLFNSYYEQIGAQFPRPRRGMLSRPTVEEVLVYRAHVDEAMRRFIERAPGKAGPIIELGLNHEQQHQELIVTDVKHMLSQNPLDPAPYGARKRASLSEIPLEWVDFRGGLVEIGHDFTISGFAFDNEGPRHQVFVEPFALASRPVTNGEFLAFIEDGGYGDPKYWLSNGWATVREQGWDAPLYWRRIDGAWTRYTLHGREPLYPREPVTNLSYYEAAAYAEWAGARLPTEFEWEIAVAGLPMTGNFLDMGSLEPRAASGETALRQMYGDVWEWTASAYVAYPRYHAPAGAIGEYNGKFMSGQMVLRGGSCATPEGHIRPTYRNFFPPDARWQFSGLRLARDNG